MTFIVTVVEKAPLITITLGQIMQPLGVAGVMGQNMMVQNIILIFVRVVSLRF
jgi:hypothetical protein